jgi:nucleoside-diphosphate-sugar epimerase
LDHLSRRLLITGATGFLGGAVIASLIADARWPSVLLLVRGADAEAGRRRIVEALRQFDVRDDLCARVLPGQIICGDLCSVPAFAADPRLRQVTQVINCAALAGFGKPRALWPTNVDGTVEFARLLHTVSPLQRFIHVGTAMSCGLPAPNLVPEDYETGLDAKHLVTYTESKIECERRLRAELPALPLVVARPSIIVGHTRLGCRPSPSIFWVFRMARALGRFTCAADDRIDVVPADYCAQAIVQLLDQPKLKHDRYHISAGPGRSCTFGEIDEAIAAALERPPTQNYQQVAYAAIAADHGRFEDLFGPCIVPIMLRAIELYGAYAALNMTFDNSRLLAEGVPPPPRFADYAGLCALTSQDGTVAEQMQYDFKGISTRAADALAAMIRPKVPLAANA